jgi:hypothetical protein
MDSFAGGGHFLTGVEQAAVGVAVRGHILRHAGDPALQ